METAKWQELINVLGKISTAYDNAVSLGERKHKALVVIDMDGLSKILDEEQLLAGKIQKLERQRGEILKELAKSESSIQPNTKMEELFRLAPTRAIEERLNFLHKNLSKKLNQTIQLRDNNQILAQGALDAVHYHLNRIGGATVENSYGNKGGGVVTHKKNFEFKA